MHGGGGIREGSSSRNPPNLVSQDSQDGDTSQHFLFSEEVLFKQQHSSVVLFDRKCPVKCSSHDILPLFQFQGNVHVKFKRHKGPRDVNLNELSKVK